MGLVALVAAGCSADPIEAYFGEVSTITASMRSEGVAATPRGNAITVDGVIGVNEARRTALEALESISPPSEVRPEHLAVVTALRDMVTGVDDFLADADTSDPAAFESAVVNAPGLPALAQRVALACGALADRSAALGTPVDIRC